MKKTTALAILLGFTLIAAANGHCEEPPLKVEEPPLKVEEPPLKVEEPPQKIEEPPKKFELSLADAVKMAIRKNIDLQVEALNASMAETDVAKSKGIYNPLLIASGTGGVLSTPGDVFFNTDYAIASIGLTQNLPTGGSITASTQTGFTSVGTVDTGTSGAVVTESNDWQSLVGVTVTQPLLKNAGKETTELNITLASNTLQDSLERFRFANTDTVLAVNTSYNHLYTLRQILESRVAALNSAQELLDEINKRVTPTPLQAMETANAEYAVAQRRKELVEAERNARDQEAALRYLIGMESKDQITPADPPSKAEPQETEDQAVKNALEHRSDLKQLRLTLESSQLQERVARHQVLPELSINGGGGLNGSSTSFGKSFQQIGERPGTWWSAGMQFSVPLGNASAKNDYLKSKIRTEQVQNQLRALKWRVRDEIHADMRALISARLQMQMADKALLFAEQRREEYRKQSRVGAATVQETIDAENDLSIARNTQAEAVENFANSVAKLWRDTGVLLDRQGVRIDISKPGSLMEGKGDAGTLP